MGKKRAKEMLLAGFTSIRDLGNSGDFLDVKLQKEIKRKQVIGPTIYTSGKGFCIFPCQFSSDSKKHEVGTEYQLIDAQTDLDLLFKPYIEKGITTIKVYADNEPSENVISLKLLKNITERAHKKGFLVTAHAEKGSSIYTAVQAGVDSIEHGYELSHSNIALMRAKNITLIPTDFSKNLYTKLFKINEFYYSKTYIEKLLTARKDRFKRVLKAGLPFAYGSDFYFNFDDNLSFGKQVVKNIKVFKEYETENSTILNSLTTVPAEMLRSKNKVGIIEKGFFADIIAVEGDPLKMIEDLEKTKFVMKHGTIYLNKVHPNE